MLVGGVVLWLLVVLVGRVVLWLRRWLLHALRRRWTTNPLEESSISQKYLLALTYRLEVASTDSSQLIRMSRQ